MSLNDYTYPDFRGQCKQFAIDEGKAKIVDLAIKLRRPLLVEGEAGCGKTQLAWGIHEALGLDRKPQIVPIKSTSRARDLLYRFDALARLQDSQIHTDDARQKAQYVFNYITLEKLGQAIYDGKPAVVLIDEVDKADVDFPNDLLDVLEDFRFDIDDLPLKESELAESKKGFGREVISEGGVRPIVVITSNGEKPLPNPFRRRCIHLEMTFPDSATELVRIVEINLKKRMIDLNQEIIDKAVRTFLSIRTLAAQRGLQKPPATSELIDWVHALYYREGDDGLTGLLPTFWEILFKSGDDLKDYLAAAQNEEPNP